MPDNVVAIIGPFGPPQLACLRSWRKLGLRVALLHTDDAELGPMARKCFDEYLFLGSASRIDEAQLRRIGNYLDDIKADGLVCIAEALAIKLSRHRTLFPKRLRLLTNHDEPLDRLVSKLNQIDSARLCGFNVLPSRQISTNDRVALATLDYPIVVRPDRPEKMQPLFKADILHSADEANRFLDRFQPGGGPIVAQPYVYGPSLVIHGSRSHDGRIGPMVCYIVDIKYEGVSVSLRPTRLSPSTEASCRAFVEHENVTGVFHFDLVRDSGGCDWFLELNARMGGTTAKVCASGLDEPAHLLVSHGLLGDTDLPADLPLKAVISRIAAIKCLFRTIKGQASEIDYPYPHTTALLVSLARGCVAWRDEVLNIRSLGTTLAYLFPDR